MTATTKQQRYFFTGSFSAKHAIFDELLDFEALRESAPRVGEALVAARIFSAGRTCGSADACAALACAIGSWRASRIWSSCDLTPNIGHSLSLAWRARVRVRVLRRRRQWRGAADARPHRPTWWPTLLQRAQRTLRSTLLNGFSVTAMSLAY